MKPPIRVSKCAQAKGSFSPERRLSGLDFDRFSPVKVRAPGLWCEGFCAVRIRFGVGLSIAIELHLDAVWYGACDTSLYLQTLNSLRPSDKGAEVIVHLLRGPFKSAALSMILSMPLEFPKLEDGLAFGGGICDMFDELGVVALVRLISGASP